MWKHKKAFKQAFSLNFFFDIYVHYKFMTLCHFKNIKKKTCPHKLKKKWWQKNSHLLNLIINVSHRPFEPFPCIHNPPKHYQCDANTKCHRCIIECIPFDWIQSWQKEDRTSVANPQKCNQANRPSCFSKIKRSGIELFLRHYHPGKDWYRVTSNPSYSAYGSNCCEDYIHFQNRKSEKNADCCT